MNYSHHDEDLKFCTERQLTNVQCSFLYFGVTATLCKIDILKHAHVVQEIIQILCKTFQWILSSIISLCKNFHNIDVQNLLELH